MFISFEFILRSPTCSPHHVAISGGEGCGRQGAREPRPHRWASCFVRREARERSTPHGKSRQEGGGPQSRERALTRQLKRAGKRVLHLQPPEVRELNACRGSPHTPPWWCCPSTRSQQRRGPREPAHEPAPAAHWRGACSGGRATSLGLPVNSRRPHASLIPALGRRKLGQNARHRQSRASHRLWIQV